MNTSTITGSVISFGSGIILDSLNFMLFSFKNNNDFNHHATMRHLAGINRNDKIFEKTISEYNKSTL